MLGKGCCRAMTLPVCDRAEEVARPQPPCAGPWLVARRVKLPWKKQNATSPGDGQTGPWFLSSMFIVHFLRNPCRNP